MATKKKKKLTKDQKQKRARNLVIFVAVIVIGYFVGNNYGWWAASGDDPTSYDLNAYDYKYKSDVTGEDELESVTFLILYKDVTDYTTDEIAALEIEDFGTKKADDDSFDDFKATEVYIWNITKTGFLPVLYVSNDWLFDGDMDLLNLGVTNVFMMNTSEDLGFLAFEEDTLGTTIASTNEDDWDVIINSLDASEGTSANVTTDEGYLPYYDPYTESYNSVVLRIYYNDTADNDWVLDRSEFNCVESSEGNYTYLQYTDLILLGQAMLDIKFNSGLGSDYELVGMAIGWGSGSSAKFVSKDTQT